MKHKILFEGLYEKPKTMKEKMSEGACIHDGLGGAMKIDRDYTYPRAFVKRTGTTEEGDES